MIRRQPRSTTVPYTTLFRSQLTEIAADKVLAIGGAEAIEDHYALRVKVMGGGCSGFQYDLYFGESAEGDNVFETQGIKLISDQMSYMYLMGTTIDYVEIVDAASMQPLSCVRGPALVVAAIRVGDTRLLDNRWIAAPLPVAAS